MGTISVISLIVGIFLVLAAVVWGIVSLFTTPHNLRGFYGTKYLLFICLAVIGGLALIAVPFLI